MYPKSEQYIDDYKGFRHYKLNTTTVIISEAKRDSFTTLLERPQLESPWATTPVIHHSTTLVTHHSTTPVRYPSLHYSRYPSLHYSRNPSLHYSCYPSPHYSCYPSPYYSRYPSLHYSRYPWLTMHIKTDRRSSLTAGQVPSLTRVLASIVLLYVSYHHGPLVHQLVSEWRRCKGYDHEVVIRGEKHKEIY